RRQALAFVEQLGSHQAGREVGVAEPKPAGSAELDEPFERVERLALDPEPAPLGDHAREPVGDEVGIGRDMKAEGGDVVASAGDDGELVRAEQVEHAAREPRATGAAGEKDDQFKEAGISLAGNPGSSEGAVIPVPST